MIINKDVHELPKNSVRFIDTRFDLAQPNWGREVYDKDHVQGAVYWHLEDHLSDMTRFEGRHPSPTKDQMSKLIQSVGLTYSDHIVIYDQGNAPFAARAALLLLWAGFPSVSIAREGYARLKELFPVEGGMAWHSSSHQNLEFQDHLLVDQQQVKQAIKENKVLLDARSNPRYRGMVEPIDTIAGHIPTALNLDWEQLKTEQGLMKAGQSVTLFSHLSPSEPIITYCGSGVTASPLAIALLENGFTQTQLYSGSYSDWIQNNQIETSK